MHQTITNLESYNKILAQEIRESWWQLSISFFAFCILTTAVLFRWKKEGGKEKKPTKKKLIEARKKRLEWCVLLFVPWLVFILMAVDQGLHLKACSDDIKNESYKTYDGEFLVSTSYVWVWNGPDWIKYHVSFHNGTEKIAIASEHNMFDLEVGVHTDKALVYSSNSKILVDVVSLNQN